MMEWIADNLIVIFLAAALGLAVAIIGGGIFIFEMIEGMRRSEMAIGANANPHGASVY